MGDVVRDTDDAPLAVEEDRVDREPHEERVDRRSRAKQGPSPGLSSLRPRRPFMRENGRRCHDAPVADDVAVLPFQGHFTHASGRGAAP